MRFGFRRRAAAAEASAGRPRLELGEQVLAAARPVNRTGQVLATDRALLLPTGAAVEEDGTSAYARLPWHTLATAGWDDASEVLTVVELGANASGLRLRLPEPGMLPEVVRERVTASVVVTAHVPLLGDKGVRILGRRRFGADELVWQLVYDPGVDDTDAGIRARAEAALEEVRERTGA